jgi:hypothetical protein
MNENENHIERRKRAAAQTDDLPTIERLVREHAVGEVIPWRKLQTYQNIACMSDRDFKLWLQEQNVLAVRGKQVIRKAEAGTE